VSVVDDNGRDCPPGVIGEIYCSLDGVPQFEYVNGEAMRRSIDREGRVTCGDVGYVDEEGYLFLVDRKKDMVISGGVNIYPAEIEGVLAAHPAISDSAVVGAPDEEFGERLVAYIEAADGCNLDPEEIVSWLRDRIAHYKVPRNVHVVSHLPRDANGKLQKRRLREPLWAEHSRRI